MAYFENEELRTADKHQQRIDALIEENRALAADNRSLLHRNRQLSEKNDQRAVEIRELQEKLKTHSDVIQDFREERARFRKNLNEQSRALKAVTASTGWRLWMVLMRPVRFLRRLMPFLRFALRNPRAVMRRVYSVWRAGGMKAVKGYLDQSETFGKRSVYQIWINRVEPGTMPSADEVKQFLSELEEPPLISILMPIYNTSEQWLEAALDSVSCQSYPHWELCIADDASSAAHVRSVLDSYSRLDKRIKVHYRRENGHIVVASNTALNMASGKFVGLMDHDDELAPHALYYIAREILDHPDAGLIYTDEDKIDQSGHRYGYYFKPDLNPDLLLSHNMISHFGVYRTESIRELGGFREGYEGSQDYDLALRMIVRLERDQVRHVPRVLYHWRAIPESTASGAEAKPYAFKAGVDALQEYLDRRKVSAVVSESPLVPGAYRVKYRQPAEPPLVSLIIPTRNNYRLLRRCVESIRKKTSYPNYEIIIVDNNSDDPKTINYFAILEEGGDARVLSYPHPFNFSAINNFAVKKTRGEVLGFLHNDTRVISTDWLSEMVSQALRPEIGAVGARLWYPDGRLQHGGVVTGVGGIAGHAMKRLERGYPGYNGRAELVQNYSAVTAACMVMRRELFDRMGGFDEINLPVAFNDVDLCLRVREAGYQNLWTPFAELYHHESASRGPEESHEKRERYRKEADYMEARWGKTLQHDPAYNPNLTLEREDFSLPLR